MQRTTTNTGASVTGHSCENCVVVKLGSFGVGSRPLELWLSTDNHSGCSTNYFGRPVLGSSLLLEPPLTSYREYPSCPRMELACPHPMSFLPSSGIPRGCVALFVARSRGVSYTSRTLFRLGSKGKGLNAFYQDPLPASCRTRTASLSDK
jgi:hypothetical protein